jgi:hypothetical protein
MPALGEPVVLLDQSAPIAAPGLVAGAQAIEGGEDRLPQSCDRDGVIEARADIADAQLEGRVAGARPDVPPDLGRVVAQAGLREQMQHVAPFVGAREVLRAARQIAEDGRPVRLSSVGWPSQNGDS